MSRPEYRAGERARRILERLGGSSRSLDESAGRLDESRVAERLQQIEQMFLLHGGERKEELGPDPDEVQFGWGHLQVLEPLGEGSFGNVYRAYDRTLDREVALKLLKTDQGRPFQSRLFLHEARQLALVRHRNVLAVHGAAIHDSRPGLWTDLIDGETAHDRRYRQSFTRLDPVLELIESLALALQAVHSAGLVHGDIKPSNLMRDGSGDWILMDFGASHDQRRAQGGPAMTSGTPLYMAPEVVLGQPPSVASDLYSMGATLYRVLVGQPPVEATEWTELKAFHESGKRPSPASQCAGVDTRVARLIDDLMAVEPSERPALEDVLARIQAIRDAPQRRFRVIALSSIAGVLLLGLTLTSIGFYRANEARMQAEQEQRNTAAVNGFLQRLLSAPDESGRVRDMTVEEMLDFAARDVGRQLDGQPEAQAAVHLALAESYVALNLSDEAQEQAQLGLALLEQIDPLNVNLHPALEMELVAALAIGGQHEASLARAQQFETTFGDRLSANSDWFVFARKEQVDNLLALDRLDEAERLLDQLVGSIPEPEQASNNLGYTILYAQANLYRARGRFGEAIEAIRAAQDWLDRHPRQRLINRAETLSNLALALNLANRKREALEVLGELFDLQAKLFGDGSEAQFGTLNNRASIYFELGELDAAMATQSQALAMIEANPDLIPPIEQLRLLGNRANLLNARQQYDEGEALIRRLMTEVKSQFGDRNRQYLILSYNLTELLNIRERFDEALPLAEQSTQAMREVLGESHPFFWLSESNRAQSLAGLGQADAALVLHEQARTALIDAMGFDHQFSLTARRQAMESRERLAPGSVPEDEIRALIETYTRQTSAEHPETRKARALLEGLD
jgi:tetratricopeptide (TPR) repeat protein